MTTELQKNELSSWFYALQNQVIEKLESLEKAYNPKSSFQFQKKTWQREDATQPDNFGGGGTMALMKGDVFEKVGVNVSVVQGQFGPEFAPSIPGADVDPSFWAAGISFVAHPKNPKAPIAHMNTRHIITSKSWFGGGGDLTPAIPFEEDTADFHRALKEACDEFNPTYYPNYKKWCDEYFFIPHRSEPRGVGGIFFDYLNSGNFPQDFAYIQKVGLHFFDIYEKIIQRRMNEPFDQEDKQKQMLKRGRYVEFNLIYDRGTLFGLKTGGNTEAILMSLPPEAIWP
jgi:coproporphyrinogen III oxidase